MEQIDNEPEYACDDRTELYNITSNRRSGNKIGLAVLLMVDMLEGLSFYTILPYIVIIFEKDLQFNKTQTVIIYLAFAGLLASSSLVSGIIGDTILTRYTCRLVSLLFSLVGGLIMLSVAVVDSDSSKNLYVVSLVFIVIGNGLVLSVVYPLGINQLADPSPKNMWSFFIWHRWFFCFGKFLSYLPIPYIFKVFGKEEALLPKAIVVVITTGLAIGVLLLGKPWINIIQPQGKKTFARLRNGCSRFLPCLCREKLNYDNFDAAPMVKRERRYNELLLKNVVLLTGLLSLAGGFNLFLTQLPTTFALQAKNLHNPTPFPDISISMFEPLITLLCVPLIEIYNRCKPHWENMTNLDIIIMGCCPLVFAPLCASILQTYIVSALGSNLETVDSGITLFAQLPQYVLIGLSDAVTYISGAEFAFKESLQHIEGFTIGLFFGAGSFLSLILFIIETVIFKKCISDDMLVQIEYHFYTLTGVAAFFIIFLIIPMSIVYRRFKRNAQQEINRLQNELANNIELEETEES